MNSSAINLFIEAKETLETAKSHLNQNEQEEAVSLLFLSAEKAITSLVILKTKKIPSLKIKLVELAEIAEIPDEYHKILKKITGKDFRFVTTGTYMYDQNESHKNDIKHMIYKIDEMLDYIEKEIKDI